MAVSEKRPTKSSLVEERFQLIELEYKKILQMADKGVSLELEGRLHPAAAVYEEIIERNETIIGMNTNHAFADSHHLPEVVSIQKKLSKIDENVHESLDRVRQMIVAGQSRSGGDDSTVFRCSTIGNAEEVFILPSVQYYRISTLGDIGPPCYPTELRINRFLESEGPTHTPQVFINVGDWVLPLIPNHTPVLFTKLGPIMFPDTSGNRGDCVGLILPSDATQEIWQILYDLLTTLAIVRVEGREEKTPEQVVDADRGACSVAERHTASELKAAPLAQVTTEKEEMEAEEEVRKTTAQKVAYGITYASQCVADGVVKGAEVAGKYLVKGTDRLKTNMHPGEDPAPPVDPRVQTGAAYARKGTHGLVFVSSKVVGLLASATQSLGRAVAPHVRTGVKRYLPESWQAPDPKTGRSPIDEAATVASSSLHGIGQIFTGLETGAKVLGRSVVRGTSDIVGHKLGDRASRTAENVMYSAGNVGMTAMNVSLLGPKGIAKVTAMEGGAALTGELANEPKGSENSSQPSGGYNSNRVPRVPKGAGEKPSSQVSLDKRPS